MLKVKRPIQPPKNKDNIEELQNEIKNSIKSLYIQNKKDTEIINHYSSAFQKVNNEYAILYKENLELKKTIEEMKKTPQQHPAPPTYRYPPKKRPLLRYEHENEDDENVQYIVRKKRKPFV